MKKSIQALLNKMEQNPDGTLKGGFASIKGGVFYRVQTNGGDGVSSCSGTNDTTGGCINKVSCSTTTNKGTCTNSNICLF